MSVFAEEPGKPAETAQLEFVVSPDQIIKEEVHEQGGRDIIVREIEPIALPEPAQPVQPEPLDPAIRQQFLERLKALPPRILINVGATIYRSSDSPVRSLVKMRNADGKPVEFWSSADFRLLSNIGEFTASDGKQRRLFMMSSMHDLDQEAARAARFGKPHQRPELPNLPAGAASFVLKSGTPSPAMLADIHALNDAYNASHEELVAAAKARVAKQAQREAELRAHPPIPKEIILNYWRIDPDNNKGGDQ